MLILPATAETVAGFIAAAEAAPDELSTIANVMPCPPMPFVPEEHHGKLVIFGADRVCRDVRPSGSASSRRSARWPSRSPTSQPRSRMRTMYPPEDPDYHPTAVSRTMFVDRVDGDVAAQIMGWLEKSDASMRVAQLRVLGGAMARVPDDATAFAHRSSRIMVNIAAFYEGPEDKAVRQAWVDEFSADLEQEDTGAYVNFLLDEGEERIRAAYPGDDLGPAGGDQGALRPDQPVPAEPEHPAGRVRSDGRAAERASGERPQRRARPRREMRAPRRSSPTRAGGPSPG